jgi:outer membrane protein assembly factor BamB
MTDLQRLVERELASAGEPSFGLPDLTLRRDRKQRRQRVGAFVVAVAVVAAVFVAFCQVLRADQREQPATPSITVSNVDQLHPVWSGASGRSLTASSVADGSVFVATRTTGTKGMLYAFPADCGSTDCPPTWTATVGPWMTQPIVADGHVFTVSVRDSSNPTLPRKLYAFDATCGSDAADCEPAWTADVSGVSLPWVAPIVRHGSVYVATTSGIDVFPARCEGSSCGPDAILETGSPVTSMTMSDDLLFAGTGGVGHRNVSAFELSCSASCSPAWTIPTDAWVSGLSTDGDRLYVGTSAGYRGAGPGFGAYSIAACAARRGACDPMWVADRRGDVVSSSESGGYVLVEDFDAISTYPADCGTRGETCRPTWTYRDRGLTQGLVPVAQGGLVFTATRDSGEVFAFSIDCADPCRPTWTEYAGMGALGGVSVTSERVIASSEDGVRAFELGR